MILSAYVCNIKLIRALPYKVLQLKSNFLIFILKER
jgi:hypothetical protein